MSRLTLNDVLTNCSPSVRALNPGLFQEIETPKKGRRTLKELVLADALSTCVDKPNVPITISCLECGKSFTSSPSHKRKYCSPKCAYASPGRTSHIKPKERGTAKCVNCESEFTLTRNSGKGLYCSQKCARTHVGSQTIHKIRRVLPVTRVETIKCPTCGVEFKGHMSSNRKYCSKKCASNNTDFQVKRIASFNSIEDKSKLHARSKKRWVEVDGKRFFARSSWEANYGYYLQFQKEQGLILDWDHEPETFWFNGIKRGTMSYLPDFKVTKSDGVEFHEVKGWMDPKSVTKIKRMAIYHPNVKLVVIDQHRYKGIAKTAKDFVKGWL